MTDIDAMHRHVASLIQFRKDAEEAINFYRTLKAGNGTMPIPAAPAAGITDEQLDKLDASLKAHLDEGISALHTRADDVEKRLAAIESMMNSTALSDRLSTLENRVGTVESDLSDVVQSLDPEAASSTGSETANAAPGDVTGAGSAGAGTDASANSNPSPAPAPEVNQDPGKEPAPVIPGVDEEAGTGPGTGGPGAPGA